MPRKPLYKSGPMTAAQRMREKRMRDRENVWGDNEDLEALSDSGLIEQLAEAFRRDRKKRAAGKPKTERGAITRGILKEIGRRL